MPKFIDENGQLRTEIIHISADYQELSKERKIEILLLFKEWIELELNELD